MNASLTKQPKNALRIFLNKTVAAVLFLISLVSGALAIVQAIPLKYLLVTAAALLGLLGWLAAFYVSYADRAATSPGDKLIHNVGQALPLPYLETWLRATVLNPQALRTYWRADAALAPSEIRCDTDLNANDASLRIRFTGVNESKDPAGSCPMLMFGGSVIHFANFPQTAVSIDANGAENNLFIRSVLDLGQLHQVEMVLPAPIRHGERFTVEHRHQWPGGMTDGEDTLWYPYPALFAHRTARMVVRVTFAAAPSYLRGLRAALDRGTCATTDIQPVAVGTDGRTFEWTIEPAVNDSAYALAFRR